MNGGDGFGRFIHGLDRHQGVRPILAKIPPHPYVVIGQPSFHPGVGIFKYASPGRIMPFLLRHIAGVRLFIIRPHADIVPRIDHPFYCSITLVGIARKGHSASIDEQFGRIRSLRVLVIVYRHMSGRIDRAIVGDTNGFKVKLQHIVPCVRGRKTRCHIGRYPGKTVAV